MNKLTIKVTRRENHADQVVDAFTKLAGTAVTKTAEEAAAEAKGLAPVHTGHLRDSIDTAKVSDTEAAFGATVDYAPFAEYGTRHEAPHPFITPAAYNSREKLLANLTEK